MSSSKTKTAASSQTFLDALKRRAILFDGAMGTLLYERGVFVTQCFEQQNLKKPDLVREVHAAYVSAGAEAIEANTFGANRLKLARFGIEAEEMREINHAGVRLAREAAGPAVWVAGSIGPVGSRIKWPGSTKSRDAELTPDEAYDIQLEHARQVAEAGVDLMVLETFREMAELELVVRAVREAAPELPLVALLTPDENGNTTDGHDAESIARRLEKLGVAAGGFNDGTGPEGMLPLMQRMKKAAPGLTLAAQPFVVSTQRIEDRTIHMATSEYVGVYAKRMWREGVKVIGLCCGANPAHVKAMSNSIRALQAGAGGTVLVEEEEEVAIEPPPAAPATTKFGQKVQAGQWVVSVEIDPPQGSNVDKALAAARTLKESGLVDAINIADGPRATARVNPASLAILLQREIGIEAIIHYCCRDRNLLGMQADLLGANLLGLHNILLITGDPPKMGDYPDATAVFDVDAIGLTRIVTRLNLGEDMAGNSIGEPTKFFNGVGANPAAQNLDHEIDRLKRKRDHGARYVMTQPVYDHAVFDRFIAKAEKVGLPILIGILPLASMRNALFLHNNVPGMAVPPAILKRMEAAPEGAEAKREGYAIAREALELARPMVQGTYIMPPFGNAKAALAVLGGE